MTLCSYPIPIIQRSYTVSAYMKSNGRLGQFDLLPPKFPPTCGLFTPKAAFGQEPTVTNNTKLDG
jgi:hypothetical protein